MGRFNKVWANNITFLKMLDFELLQYTIIQPEVNFFNKTKIVR